MLQRRLRLALSTVVLAAFVAEGIRAQELEPLHRPLHIASAQAAPPPQAETQRPQSETLLQSASRTDDQLEIIVGQGRLLTLKQPIAEPDQPSPVIATGDPTVVDFEVLGPRQIRVTGQRIGVTDLSIITEAEDPFTIEVHVVADLAFLRNRLQQLFPDASLRLSHLRQHVVIEGQARSAQQIAQIIETVEAFLSTIQPEADGGAPTAMAAAPAATLPAISEEMEPRVMGIIPEPGRGFARVGIQEPEIINLIRVPGPQQVLLKVQIAELNRTALRQLGVSLLFQDAQTAIGTNMAGGLPATRIPSGDAPAGLMGLLDPVTAGTSAFAIFSEGEANFFVDALERNQIFKTLAEPTLVAMHGQEASFLSGGEFPVPVPQSGAATGAITIQYREFGVGLDFVPFILDDETVRLAVAPEVSSIDFSLGIVQAGVQVPALNTRKTKTVVELRQGQTLAISGLLQVDLDGSSDRLPGLGNLPYVGPLFRSNSMRRVEKELIVLVTPYLVEPLDPHQVAPPPGAEVGEPDSHELYFDGNLENRCGPAYRSTTGEFVPPAAEAPHFENEYMFGPHGYSP